VREGEREREHHPHEHIVTNSQNFSLKSKLAIQESHKIMFKDGKREERKPPKWS